MLKVGSEIIDISQGGSTYFNKIYQGEDLLWEYETDDNQDVIYYQTYYNTDPIPDEEFYNGTGVEVEYNKFIPRRGMFKVKFKHPVTKINNNFLQGNGWGYLSLGRSSEPVEYPVELDEVNNTFRVLLPAGDVQVMSIPTNALRYVEFVNFNQCKEIGSLFLASQYSMKAINLEGLKNVETIDYMFLHSNYSESIDLNWFPNLKQVYSYFLGASHCTEIDTTPLISLEKMGGCFLYGSSFVKKVNLNGLCKLTYLESSFMRDCRELEILDISPLYNIERVEYNSTFMGCEKLKTLLIDVPNKTLSLVLNSISRDTKGDAPIESIYVNDELIDQYREEVTVFSPEVFKPLSEYKPKEI